MGAALRSVVHQVDPAVPVMDVTTVSQIVWGSVADRRFYTAVISAFAALAILLTATGLVVVIARSVAERRRELAISLRAGAESRQLNGPGDSAGPHARDSRRRPSAWRAHGPARGFWNGSCSG